MNSITKFMILTQDQRVNGKPAGVPQRMPGTYKSREHAERDAKLYARMNFTKVEVHEIHVRNT